MEQNHKLHIGTRLSAIILAIMAIIAFAVTNSLNNSYWWLAHTHKVIEKAQEIDLQLVQCQSDNRGYIITNDQEFLINYQEYSDKILENIEELKVLTRDNATQQKNINELIPLCAAKLSRIRKNITLVDSEKVNEAIDHVKTGEGEVLMRKIQRCFDNIRKEEFRLLDIRAENVEENFKYVAYGVPMLIIVALGMLIITSRMGY